ncbi:hypothetical protein [Staphylococcus aureus]|nr:hypothetical protein [Staphylococcus aureus]
MVITGAVSVMPSPSESPGTVASTLKPTVSLTSVLLPAASVI